MAGRMSDGKVTLVKRLCLCLALLPLARLAWLAWHDGLGANPVEYLSRATGWWTLAGLMITLSVTPLRRMTGWYLLLRVRRTLGLCTFAYGLLHFSIYLWLDQAFDWAGILADVVKRPFITVGFSAFALMIPLAATSSDGMVRRLGSQRWQRLHSLVYAVAVLGVMHFWWLVKKDIREPLAFACVLAVLLLWRLWRAAHRSSASLDSSIHTQVT